MFNAAGVSAVQLPGAEILPAAERGVIDAAEWVGGIADLEFGFHTVWKYTMAPGVHEQVTVGDLLINKDRWDSLPADLQAIVEAAAVETFWVWKTKWHGHNADAYEEMTTKHGVTLIKTPQGILDEFMSAYDKARRAVGRGRRVVQEGARFAARLCREDRAVPPVLATAL